MILQTASEGISLARKLESDSAQFYQDMARKFPQGAGIFESMAKENKKNIAQVESSYYGVITDAIEGCYAFQLDPDNYPKDLVKTPVTSYENALKQAVRIEEGIIKFYSDAAEQSKSLMADVPQTFRLIAKKRGARLTQLKTA
jgi:rubrerythrin